MGGVAPVERNIRVALEQDDGTCLRFSGRLQDPFHDMTVSLTLRRSDLTVVAASGRMDWVPYGQGCPVSLARLEGVPGLAVGPGMGKALAGPLGGELGCPYLVELAEQICRFALVVVRTEQGQQLVLAQGDRDGFRRLRAGMGACSGHTLAGHDELPQWLERKRREDGGG